MPRKDRTFTGTDVIRIFNQHLDQEEKADVLLSLCKGTKIETFDGRDILVPILVAEEGLEEDSIIESIVFFIADRGASFFVKLIDALVEKIGF